MHRATITVAAGRPDPVPDAPLNQPVEFASALVAGGAIEYSRHDARNSAAFETVLGALEQGHALMFASGMAAITATLDVLSPTSVATPPVLYSGTRAALDARPIQQVPTLRWPAHSVDVSWVESPTNPDLRVIDIAAAADASGHTVVDNTFATPLAQRPLGLGADVVIHSVSKYLSGHSDLILGAVVCSSESLAAEFARYRELTGAIPGPMEAWLALRGLRTLDVRYRRAAANAAVLAARLCEHPAVADVVWPGLPGHPDHDLAARTLEIVPPMIGVVPVAGQSAADAVCREVRLWSHATSLGGVESTLERRRRHAFESDAVDPGLLRLSVGIEDVDDLWQDLSGALDRSAQDSPS